MTEPACPHIRTSDEGTSYCELAESRVKKLEAEVNEYVQLTDLLANLLHATANALKGPPEPLHLHSWHDLPEVAAALATERDKLREALA
jgi:hypothetical protein